MQSNHQIHIDIFPLIQLLLHSAYGQGLSPLQLPHEDELLYLPRYPTFQASASQLAKLPNALSSIHDPSSLLNRSFFCIQLLSRPNARPISGQAVLALAIANASHHALDASTPRFAYKLNNTRSCDLQPYRSSPRWLSTLLKMPARRRIC